MCLNTACSDVVHNVSCSNKEKCDDRYSHNSCQHEQTLNKVRYTYCHKSTHESVSQNYYRTDSKTYLVVDTEYRVEKLSTCRKSRRCVNKEEYDDCHRRYQKHYLVLVLKSVFKILRKRQGVVRSYSVSSQSARNYRPVKYSADKQTYSYPYLPRSECVNSARQSHEHPA